MSDDQVRTVLGVVAVVIAAAIAALTFGGKAVDVVLTAATCWLIWNRKTLADLVDQAVDDADRATRGTEAIAHHLASNEPPSSGRHAHARQH